MEKKPQKYHIVGTVLKSQKKHKFCKIETPNTHNHSLSMLGSETSIESDRVK